ncbi:MAG TPA: hypothetical protein VF263_09900 [Longimicrobiaceae bacterium]
MSGRELFDRVRRDKGLACDFRPPKEGVKRAIGECMLYEHRMALYHEWKGTISFRYTPPTGAGEEVERGRTGARTEAEAFVFANGFLREKVARFLRSGATRQAPVGLLASTATLRDAYDYVRAHFRSCYEEKQWREVLKVFHCTEQVWDLDRPYTSLSGRDVDRYIQARVEVGLALAPGFSRRPGLRPCKRVTAVGDLQVLATLCRRLQAEVDEETEEMPFRTNPFGWLRLPQAEKALRTKPAAERYAVLMRYVDRVDPAGQLRLVLVLTRWLGRRLGSVARLQRKDLRLTTDEMLETVRLIERRGPQRHDGPQSEAFAYEFIRGGIFFDRDRDKEKYQRLVPSSTLIRREIDAYLARHQDLDPEGPLFPGAKDPRRPRSVMEFIALLHAAEELARAEGFRQEVPVLFKSVFHGFRGLRATEMENGGTRPAHVNFIVGWSCKTGSVKEVSYLGHDARLLYAAVEGTAGVEAG